MLTFDLKKINLPPGSKVLDVGCGEGRHIFGILNEFEDVYCYGIDQDIPSLDKCKDCLLYTSPSPRDVEESRMPSSA